MNKLRRLMHQVCFGAWLALGVPVANGGRLRRYLRPVSGLFSPTRPNCNTPRVLRLNTSTTTKWSPCIPRGPARKKPSSTY